MGFLDGPAEQVDSMLAAVFASPPEHNRSQRKWAEKALAKESQSIMTLLRGTGETCLAVAHDHGMDSNVIVVTNRRTFQMKRGRVRKELAHSAVAETKIGTMPSGDTMVMIESHEARRDYSPSDPMRTNKIIYAEVATPGIAQAIYSPIDQRISSGSSPRQGSSTFLSRRDVSSWLDSLGEVERDYVKSCPSVAYMDDFPPEEEIWAILPASLAHFRGLVTITSKRFMFAPDPANDAGVFLIWPGAIGSVGQKVVAGQLRIGFLLLEGTEFLAGEDVRPLIRKYEGSIAFLLGLPAGPNSLEKYALAVDRFVAVPPADG